MTSFEGIDKWNAEIKDPGRGKHLWMVTAAYRVDDPTKLPTQPLIMDHETLMSVIGCGCWKCEKLWEPGLEKKWCNGSVHY